MKYNDNGEYKDIYIKTFDTLPVGAIVEYNGATIPDGWTDLGNGKIEKTSQYIEGGAGLPSYFTTETNTGMKWIDGKTIYRKVIEITSSQITGQTVNIAHNISNIDTVTNQRLIWCRNAGGKQHRQFPSVYYSNNDWDGQVFVHQVNIVLELGPTILSNMQNNLDYCYIIVEYTKSS